MLFLLRTAFWLTIVLVLLPGVPKSGETKDNDIGAFDAMTAATAAMSDAGGFCSRQPQACAIGSQVLETVGERAGAGARMVLDYVGSQIASEKRKLAERALSGRKTEDTLTSGDLGPAWQGLPAEPAAAAGSSAEQHVPLPPKRPA